MSPCLSFNLIVSALFHRFDPISAEAIDAAKTTQETSVFSHSGQVEPVTLQFKDLRYEIDIKEKKKVHVSHRVIASAH